MSMNMCEDSSLFFQYFKISMWSVKYHYGISNVFLADTPLLPSLVSSTLPVSFLFSRHTYPFDTHPNTSFDSLLVFFILSWALYIFIHVYRHIYILYVMYRFYYSFWDYNSSFLSFTIFPWIPPMFSLLAFKLMAYFCLIVIRHTHKHFPKHINPNAQSA